MDTPVGKLQICHIYFYAGFPVWLKGFLIVFSVVNAILTLVL